MTPTVGIRWGETVARIVVILLLAFAIFGPLANLVLWAFAERWYFPHKFPQEIGLTYWARVFAPRGSALQAPRSRASSAMPAKTAKPSQWFCLKARKQPSRVRLRISV